MTALDKAYADLLAAPSDMQKHLPKLKELAAGKRVIEFGTRRGVSTVALLAGRPRSLITYDMVRTKDVDTLHRLADDAGIEFEFRECDIWDVTEVPAHGCAFIDWMHHREAVMHSFRLCEKAGATTIALHDTHSFARHGDLPGTRGILDAVDEFLAARPNWRISYHTDECYGFTTLEQCADNPKTG